MTAPGDTRTTVRSRGRIFYGWYIVAASVATNFYISLTFFQGFQAFFLPILNEFQWSRTLMSGAFSLRQLEDGMLAPVIGILVDRWGPRRVILTGVVIGGAGMIFLGLITSAWMFYLAFAIVSIGVSGAGHGISWPAIVSNWFRRLRGRAVGLAMTGPVTSGPFVVLIVLLEERVGWRAALVGLGAGLWLVGIPLGMIARPRPEPYGYLPDGEPPAPSGEGQNTRQDAASALGQAVRSTTTEGLSATQAVRTRAFWVLSATFGLHSLGVSGFMAHQLPLFQGLGFSAREGAVILGLIFFLSGVGRLFSGTLMDYLDRRLVLGGALMAQTVSYLMLTALSTSWALVVAFALIFGAAFGSTIPARPITVRELFGPRAFGTINGLMQGVALAMGMIGPVIMGAVFDLQGTYTPAILGFAALTAVSIPLPLLLHSPLAEATDPRR